TEELLAKLNKITPSDSNVPVERRLLAGDPAEAIIRLAETEKADLIVIGTHGRRGLRRVLMGSVAEVVVRTASCPVLTVKQGAHAVPHN
ncbi:MAG: universal stress protein, partial [Planctomycetales bacterium]|nr:universal stress protein [Planctomycetales bacterium]